MQHANGAKFEDGVYVHRMFPSMLRMFKARSKNTPAEQEKDNDKEIFGVLFCFFLEEKINFPRMKKVIELNPRPCGCNGNQSLRSPYVPP